MRLRSVSSVANCPRATEVFAKVVDAFQKCVSLTYMEELLVPE
jgi:hypothetical protein